MKVVILIVLILSCAYSYASGPNNQNGLMEKRAFAVCKGEGIRAYIYEGNADIWTGLAGSANILLIKGHQSLGLYSGSIGFDNDGYPIVVSPELELNVMISDEDLSYVSIRHLKTISSVCCYLKIN